MLRDAERDGEERMQQTERKRTEQFINEARDKVSSFYGERRGDPRILVCASDDCNGKMGGGSRGMAMFEIALILASGGDNPVIAAHNSTL